MSGFNKVILMGNLTKDPEVRHLQNGTAVVGCTIVVSERYKDKQTDEWKEVPSYIDVKLWGKRGEAFAKYHKKGDRALVEGSLKQESWEDKTTGAKRSKVYVNAMGWEFCGGDKGKKEAPATSEREPDFLDVDNTPF